MPFQLSPALEEQILGHPDTQAALVAAAEATAKVAESIAPRASGYYAAHFVAGLLDGQAVVGNTDFAAVVIEYGSSNNPAFATLRRAVAAAGYRLAESE